MPHAMARQRQKDPAYVRLAQAANTAIVRIACEHVALQHANQSTAGALARCNMRCSMHHRAGSVACMLRERTWHVRREQLLYSKPRAMEYSPRSNCLVSLFEGGDVRHGLGESASSITVLDLAAGGRKLCQLEDIMCALLHPAPCSAHVCLTASQPAHCTAQGGLNRGVLAARQRLRQRGGDGVCSLW